MSKKTIEYIDENGQTYTTEDPFANRMRLEKIRDLFSEDEKLNIELGTLYDIRSSVENYLEYEIIQNLDKRKEIAQATNLFNHITHTVRLLKCISAPNKSFLIESLLKDEKYEFRSFTVFRDHLNAELQMLRKAIGAVIKDITSGAYKNDEIDPDLKGGRPSTDSRDFAIFCVRQEIEKCGIKKYSAIRTKAIFDLYNIPTPKDLSKATQNGKKQYQEYLLDTNIS